MGSTTITSDAYILSTTKASLINDLFLIFLNYSKNNVTDISSWHGSFPDVDLTSASSYPQGIVEMPEISWEKLTIKKKKVPGTITIEIYDTNKKDLITNMSDLTNSIETKRPSFRALGVNFVNLDAMGQDTDYRGELKVHMASATFSFTYNFTGSL